MRIASIGLVAVLLGSAVQGAPVSEEQRRKLGPFLDRLTRDVVVRQADRSEIALKPGSVGSLRTLPSFVRRRGDTVFAHAFIELGDAALARLENTARSAGGRVQGRVGPIVTLALPVGAIGKVAALEEVRWLKAAQRYRLMNETSTGAGFVDSDGANATFGAMGQGVIVAVIDTGIDWTSLDFRNADGTTRILGIWDQTVDDASYPPPAGFSFGSYYSQAQIEDALQNATSLPTQDHHGHGSHVTGTAAGNGLQTGNGVTPGTFAGLAPEADILVIKLFEGADADFCDQCDVAAAVGFAESFAVAAGKPWVGNLSIGSSLGAHDGSSASELAMDAVVGPGRPGRQIAVAAGNSGSTSRHHHWEQLAVQGTTHTNTFDLPSSGSAEVDSDEDFLWLDLWYAGDDQLTVTLETPDGTRVSAARGADSGIVCTPSGAVQVDATNAPDPANGENQVALQVWDSPSCDPVVDPEPGTYTLEIEAVAVGTSGRPFDVWNAADTRGRYYVNFADFDLHDSLTTPGTSHHAITAASYLSKTDWTNVDNEVTSISGTVGSRSFFSGIGPTRDGRNKPDIAAPGEWVGSTISAGDLTPPSNSFQERDGAHHNFRGTSMATPHVAGAVAVLLSINPTLDGATLAETLVRSAQTDSFTGAVPNTSWGHGKMRVHEAGFEVASIVTDLSGGPTGFAGGDSTHMDGYNVYRGVFPGFAAGSLGTCFLQGLASPDFSDGDVPALGTGYFYLVSGVWTHPLSLTSVEGTLGTDSSGAARRPASSCP